MTVVHVTHEAITKVGGIGAVLNGLLTSRAYLDGVPRNILVGPFWPSDDDRGEHRLGPQGEVLYSSVDGLVRTPLAARFREIEQDFGVSIVYGRRRFVNKETGVSSSPEVVLIDVAGRYNAEKLGAFKFSLYEKFGIESSRYEHVWDFEQYMRLAQPAIACLHALGVTTGHSPCVILSHEYMGVPTALAGIMENGAGNFHTIFHAHECAPMRRLVEGHAGHDTMFYNVMRAATAGGHYVDDVFGDQSDYYKYALVRATRFFDTIFAVGDYTLKEMRFMGPDFSAVDAQVAYNGVPAWPITLADKLTSRRKLKQYANTLLKFEPDYIFTHVTRLVVSKGLWRDLRVLEHVDRQLRDRNESAVMFVLSTEVPARRSDDIRRMEAGYRWPVVHREGNADLSTGEAVYYQGVQEFNAIARNVKVVFINQFGFDRNTVGNRLPADTEFMDIRKGSDVEFGQSIYEPFGIAQVEPISFGGICVYSSVCGCAGFVKAAADGAATPNAIVADYTELSERSIRPEQMLSIGQRERDAVENVVAQRVANELVNRLPRTPADLAGFLERGQALAANMSWDVVATKYILPGIDSALKRRRLTQIA